MNACFGRTPSLPWRPLYTPAIPPVPAVQPRVACLPSETLALCPATDRPRPEARVPSWTLYGRSAAESCPSCHGHDAPQLAIPVLIGDCDFGDQERFRNGSWGIEPLQRRRVVDQDATARRFVRRPVRQEVEQNCVVGLGVGLFGRIRPLAPQTIRSGDAFTYARATLLTSA
jgi:hypothetical protein